MNWLHQLFNTGIRSTGHIQLANQAGIAQTPIRYINQPTIITFQDRGHLLLVTTTDLLLPLLDEEIDTMTLTILNTGTQHLTLRAADPSTINAITHNLPTYPLRPTEKLTLTAHTLANEWLTL